jgi:hypothetical protein
VAYPTYVHTLKERRQGARHAVTWSATAAAKVGRFKAVARAFR